MRGRKDWDLENEGVKKKQNLKYTEEKVPCEGSSTEEEGKTHEEGSICIYWIVGSCNYGICRGGTFSQWKMKMKRVSQSLI